MKLILIGEEHSRRTDYLKKAAGSLNIQLDVICWNKLQGDFPIKSLDNAFVKIDPPCYQTIRLSHMQSLLAEYQKTLQKLMQADCHFLNSPEAIWQLLDKKRTKEYLQKHNIPATQMFSEDIQEPEQLISQMHENHCYSVFVKPRYFSGAAGVAAFRVQPASGKMMLYTSCRLENKELINTKNLSKLSGCSEIIDILEKLLTLGCVVERWHPKADFRGKSYDLRVVFQYGHIAHIVVRQSDGPITNLHLNNQALDVQSLGLDAGMLQNIADICSRATAGFEGLNMSGIDILLEKKTMRPLIIEMNGQGDLIYQDIFGENNIYREQVEKVCRI